MSTFLTPNLLTANGDVAGMVCRIVNCGDAPITLSGNPTISLIIQPGNDVDLSYNGTLSVAFGTGDGKSAVVYTN